MNAEIAAVRDRLLWEGAHVSYLVDLIPDEQFDEVVPETGWTVRQTLAHLALSNERHATILAGLRHGQPVPPFITPEENAQQVAPVLHIELDDLYDLLDDQRDALRSQLAALDDETWVLEARPGQPVAAMVQHWAGHYAEHTWHILGVLPELRFEPLLANWLLYVDYEADGRPELRPRQEQLIADFRELLQSQEADDE